MERLTDKNHNAINKCSEYSSCYSCHKENCYISELEQKLGELEDVLEKWNIEDLDKFLDEQISDLQHRLEVAERATKLACDDLRNLNYRTFNNRDIDFEQQFKEQAEKEVKGE